MSTLEDNLYYLDTLKELADHIVTVPNPGDPKASPIDCYVGWHKPVVTDTTIKFEVGFIPVDRTSEEYGEIVKALGGIWVKDSPEASDDVTISVFPYDAITRQEIINSARETPENELKRAREDLLDIEKAVRRIEEKYRNDSEVWAKRKDKLTERIVQLEKQIKS